MGRIKRIVILVSNDLTYDQRMHRTARALQQAGYEVTLVGRQKHDSIPLSRERYDQKRFRLLFEKGKLFYLFLNQRLFTYLLFKRFDLVLAVDADTLLAATVAAMLRGKKLVYDAHEFFTEVPELVGRSGARAVWQWVERFGITRCNLCYTVSQGVANLYSDRYKIPFQVIRNLPEHQQELPGTKKIPKSIIYQGALNEGRGLEAMIAAMTEIDGKLILAGEGDISTQLKALAHSRGVEEKVEFKGYVAPGELTQLTPTASIGINLLENKGLSYYHSLANKFFAYVQAGIPQVCINFPEYRLLNQAFEVAILIDDLKEKTIREAVEELFYNEDKCQALKKNCMRAREAWCWEKEERQLLEMFSNCCS